MNPAIEPMAHDWVAALFNGVYQGIVLAVLVWLGFRLFRGANATTHHAVTFVALLAAGLLPVFHLVISVADREPLLTRNEAIPFSSQPKELLTESRRFEPVDTSPDTDDHTFVAGSEEYAVAPHAPQWAGGSGEPRLFENVSSSHFSSSPSIDLRPIVPMAEQRGALVETDLQVHQRVVAAASRIGFRTTAQETGTTQTFHREGNGASRPPDANSR